MAWTVDEHLPVRTGVFGRFWGAQEFAQKVACPDLRHLGEHARHFGDPVVPIV
jgi:hypothetical protein